MIRSSSNFVEINCNSSNFPKDLYLYIRMIQFLIFFESIQNDFSKNYLININYTCNFYLETDSLIEYILKGIGKIVLNFNIPLTEQYFLTFYFEITYNLSKLPRQLEKGSLYSSLSLPQWLLLVQLQSNYQNQKPTLVQMCVYILSLVCICVITITNKK